MVQVIDYDILIDELRHEIVKKSLKFIKADQLPGNHYFYITFLTSHPDVRVSRRLLEKYPHEMTIILQHQFRDLIVRENFFSIILHFDGIEEQLEIPYSSLISFADPSAKFGLHFKRNKMTRKTAKMEENKSLEQDQKTTKDNIISLEHFRNKLTSE